MSSTSRRYPEDDPVRVLFVSTPEHGGAELALQWLIGELGPEWVAGVALLGEGPLAESLRAEGIPVDVISPPVRRAGAVRASLELRKAIRARSPDVVQGIGFKAALLAAPVTTLSRTPLVWLKVDLAHDGLPANLLSLLCRQVVTVSRTAGRTFRGPLRRRLRVVPNGIPQRKVDPAAARRQLEDLVGTRGTALVCLTGRVCPGKGQLELIEAAPQILRGGGPVRLVMLGPEDVFHPGYLDRLRRRTEELGVAESITFLGYRDDAAELIAGCDVVVVPSMRERTGWQEGFGLVVAEAFWAGVPVVAYDTGSLPEIVGPCGVIVSEGDRAALSDAVLSLLADDERRARLVRCGRHRVSQNFTLRSNAEGMKRCYLAAGEAA